MTAAPRSFPDDLAAARAVRDHAAATTDGRLPFLSAAELKATVPDEPDWLWNGYVAPGALALVAGKPKVGKSTLVTAMAEAVVSRAPSFLGRAIAGGPVVLVSEEAAGTLVSKLPAHSDLRVLTRDAAWPQPPWAAVVAGATDEAKRVGAVLLVVDTFGWWAALRAEAEKDAGAVRAALAPLVEATRAGLAVVLVHHARKAGGEDGDAIRGSSGIAGAADVLLELGRARGNPRHRRVAAVGRWPQTPDETVVERDPTTGAWRVIDDGAERPAEQRDELADGALAVFRALEPDERLSGAEVTRRLGRKKGDGTVRRALERLGDQGLIEHEKGAGWGLPTPPMATLPGVDAANPQGTRAQGVATTPDRNDGNPGSARRCQGGTPYVVGAADGNPPATVTTGTDDGLVERAELEAKRIAAKWGSA